MKNFLFFLSFVTVFMFAVIDYIDYFNKLADNVAIKTPAQVEIKKDVLKPLRGDGKNIINQSIDIPQNSSFNDKLRNQQNTNIPQFKQPNPLQTK